eukprot:8116926-Alexandrium_andersonii.AAC.1
MRSRKGPGTVVRGRAKVQAPLCEVVQRSRYFCARVYKGPGTPVRGRSKVCVRGRTKAQVPLYPVARRP